MNYIGKILKKILSLLLGYPLYLISFIVPRNKKKIVVGSHTPFNDNSKYFFLLSKKYLPHYLIIWITKDKAVEAHIRSLGYLCYRKNTIKGLYHTLTAKYYIYSFHLPDINFWTSGRSIKFNLWHGIPLKDIAFSIQNGPSAKLYNEKNILSRIIRPHIFVRPTHMLTTSTKMSKYFAKAFRISEKQCLEFGMPRCEILTWDKKHIFQFIETYESSYVLNLVKTLQMYKKVYIYMPTWREEVDFLYHAGFNFKKLNQRLIDNNSIFLFKLHPFTKLNTINLQEINQFSNIIVIHTEIDIYPILPFTDCLITDYSSIYYDYLLCKDKAIYLYPYDYETYISTNRDLAFDYLTHMPAKHLLNFEDLLNLIDNAINTFTKEQILIKKHYFKSSINSTKVLSQYIKENNK